MNIAIIFAGGIGSRMKNPDLPKQFLEIDNTPILVHTIRAFQNNDEIDKIIVVMLKEYIEYTKKLMAHYELDKVVAIVEGGATGQESIYHGLVAASRVSRNDSDIVLIHDGVRPIIEPDLIHRNIESVENYSSAISCSPSKETIAKIDENGCVVKTIKRSAVWIARAPQSFFLKDILEAHEKAQKNNEFDSTDSCTLMSTYSNKPLHSVETWAENIKITTPDDYYTATALIKKLKDNDE